MSALRDAWRVGYRAFGIYFTHYFDDLPNALEWAYVNKPGRVGRISISKVKRHVD